MISLIFKIAADAAGFNRTLKTEMPATAKAAGKTAGKESGAEFGKEFGNQVKGAVMSVIGISAIAAAIKKAVTDAGEIAKEASAGGIGVEAAQELQRAAKLTGLSVEEVKASATTAPEQFASLMRYVQKTGGPKLGQSDVETLTSTGDLFSGISSAIAIGFSKAASFAGGAALDVAGRASIGLGSLGQSVGLGGSTTDQLMRGGVMLEGMRDRSYERGFGIAQGDLNNPSGALVRKLEELKQTMEKKL